MLIAEMEHFGTLESPFEPEYLASVLGEAGFQQVTRFAVVDELLDVAERERELQRLEAALASPRTNTVMAVKPVPALVGAAAEFLAEVDARERWQTTPDRRALVLPITVANVGSGVWPAAAGPAFPLGTVTVAPYLRGATGEKVELPRVPLPRSVIPGESIPVEIRIPPAEVVGQQEVMIDLVREGIAWFEEYGSPQVRVPLNGA